MKIHSQLWNIMPDGRKAYFYNIWDGKGTESFQAQLRETFTELTTLLASGALKPQCCPVSPKSNYTSNEIGRITDSLWKGCNSALK